MQIMDLLAWSRLSQSLAGQKELMEIIKHHAELSKSFDPSNPEDVDRSIYCSLHCVPYLCSAIPSTPFVSYLCEQVSWHACFFTIGTYLKKCLLTLKLCIV